VLALAAVYDEFQQYGQQDNRFKHGGNGQDLIAQGHNGYRQETGNAVLPRNREKVNAISMLRYSMKLHALRRSLATSKGYGSIINRVGRRPIMRKQLLAVAATFLLAASAASPAFAGSNDIIGTGLGAALGGLLGSQFGRGGGQLAATGAGVFFGGLVGNSVGTSIDRTNYLYSHHGGYYTYAPAPVYYPATYSYQPTYVAPPEPPPAPATYTYAGNNGSYCREFSQQVTVGGRVQESYGTACLQPDGSWRIVP
jgi:surface antigen